MTSTATAPLPTVRPYQHYVYAYPHKTAYRPLPRERASLRELWADEPKEALSLYFHIPFCEVRCGFCNLFTRIGAPDGLATAYLDALERQAAAVREALGDTARYANAAFGGGTPTFLQAAELERLGVRRLSAGSGIAQMLWGQAGKLAQDFLDSGRSESMAEGAMPYPQLQALFAGR